LQTYYTGQDIFSRTEIFDILRVLFEIGIGTLHLRVFHISAILEKYSKYVHEGLISLQRAFPLHRKVSSLRSLERILYGYIFARGLPVVAE